MPGYFFKVGTHHTAIVVAAEYGTVKRHPKTIFDKVMSHGSKYRSLANMSKSVK